MRCARLWWVGESVLWWVLRIVLCLEVVYLVVMEGLMCSFDVVVCIKVA